MAGRLDPIDLQILAELQEDGRMTNVELARRVGISAPPCLRRLRALERSGILRGFHAEIDEKQLGFDITAMALVGLHSQAEADLNAFIEQVNGWPYVRECYMLSGDFDFILKCVAPDMDSWQKFLIDELTAASSVESVRTALALRRTKFEPGVPINLINREEDALT